MQSTSNENQTTCPIADIRIGQFPKRLKTAIGELSARAFAQKIGISGAAVRKYLAGESEPTRPVLIAMADMAGVRVEWLATGEGAKEPESIKLTETAAHNALRSKLKEQMGAGSWKVATMLGFSAEKYRKYVNGLYIPTEEELKFLCENARWDFESGSYLTISKVEKQYEIEIAAEIVGCLDEVFIEKEITLPPEKKKRLFILLMEKATSLGLSKHQVKNKIDEYINVLGL